MRACLTLSESRRAVWFGADSGARHSCGLYEVRSFGCGVTDQVRRTRKSIGLGQWFRSGQTVVKVCCWHQERNDSAGVFFRARCSS